MQSQQEDREKRDKKAIKSDIDEQEKIVQMKAETKDTRRTGMYKLCRSFYWC